MTMVMNNGDDGERNEEEKRRRKHADKQTNKESKPPTHHHDSTKSDHPPPPLDVTECQRKNTWHASNHQPGTDATPRPVTADTANHRGTKDSRDSHRITGTGTFFKTLYHCGRDVSVICCITCIF